MLLPARALIGMVHVRALPGSPGHELPPAEIAAAAARDALVLADAGFDALIIENMHDAPYVHGDHPPETVAAMTRVALAVREVVPRLPMGVQILSGGNKEALAVALAAGLQFIRCENFVFAHVADEGLLIRAEAGPLLRYRKAIGAAHVKVFADIKKKHASHAITADVPLAEMVEGAAFFGADAVVITGTATGKPAALADVQAARKATTLPVLVGSGAAPDNAAALLRHADALIVGSWIKYGGVWRNAVSPERCREFLAAARGG